MEALHPTPQKRRRDWFDLGGTWGFAYDDEDLGESQRWWSKPEAFTRQIHVPFPPESAASGIGDTSFHPVVWYRRTFQAEDVPGWSEGRTLRLHFGAVDYAAQVWLNGSFLGAHEGGHTPFVLDGTNALEGGSSQEQVLVVRAYDSPHDLSQPRGKQHWEEEPRRVWYHRTTGIWQPVWAEAVSATHLSDVCWSSDVARGVIGLEVSLNTEPPRPLRLRVVLSLRGTTLADDRYEITRQALRRDIGLPPFFINLAREDLLWSPAHPNLVDATITLEESDGQVVDKLESYVGIRSIDTEENLFVLNGMPQYLRMVLSQGYWPDTHLAAPSAEALRDEVSLIKDLGFNGVRVHQKLEDPRFLYECDRQGLLVWSEMPSAYSFDAAAVGRFTREWLEAVRRDVSSPSVVTWVPFNESWGVPQLSSSLAQQAFVRGIYSLTKAVDPSRPVIGNDGWEHVEADIWGIHDYALSGAALRERWGSRPAQEASLAGRPLYPVAAVDGVRHDRQPVVISEMGGISYHVDPDRPWHGYGSASRPEEVLSRYDELVGALLDAPGLAGFCYTQLTDTEQESNGLVDAQRKPKVFPSLIAEVNRRPARAVPGEVLLHAQSSPESARS